MRISGCTRLSVKTYGNNDKGHTWFLSVGPIDWDRGKPTLGFQSASGKSGKMERLFFTDHFRPG